MFSLDSVKFLLGSLGSLYDQHVVVPGFQLLRDAHGAAIIPAQHDTGSKTELAYPGQIFRGG